MELRTLLVLGCLLALMVGNLYFIATEGDLGVQEEVRPDLKKRDPLIDIVYTSSERATNFALFGMTDDMITRAMERIEDLDEEYTDKILGLLQQAAQPIAVADSLCGNTGDVRPRYGALNFLVKVDGEFRRPIDLRRVSELELQDWAQVSPWRKVFEVAELGSDRQDNATVMGLAAIILEEETALLTYKSPWGKPITGRWSWRRLTQNSPSITGILVEYLAMMHLTVELAQADDGICGA